MDYEVPKAIMISSDDGFLMISAIFDIPEELDDSDFLMQAVRSTSRQLKSSTPIRYVLEVQSDGTHIFHQQS